MFIFKFTINQQNVCLFRFCVASKREGYPEDFSPQINSDVQSKRLKISPQPAHTLTLMPPLTLVNLLPCDMSYRIKSVTCMGTIRAGKSVPIYSVSENENTLAGIFFNPNSYRFLQTSCSRFYNKSIADVFYSFKGR